MEEKNKKTKNKAVVIAVIIVLLVIIGAVGGVVYNDLHQKSILISEVNKLVANKNLTVDSIDADNMKTTGKYAEVEKAIKTYLKEYAAEVEKMVDMAQDEKIINILSIDNYKNDGPEFNESLPYIEEMEKNLNETSEKVIKLMGKEEILGYIDNYDLDDKYKELYKTLMLDEETEKKLEESQTQLKDSIDEYKESIQKIKDVLNFLKENKSGWEIQNNLVMFNSQELLSQYNKLTKELK